MRQPLDIYDEYPKEMRRYLQSYGWHFNKRACDFAVSLMKKKDPISGKKTQIVPWTKEQVSDMLKRNAIELENDNGYDSTYVANMCKADYFGGSVQDEEHVAMFVKETIDDDDAGDGTTMRRWYATIVANGEVVFWEDFL